MGATPSVEQQAIIDAEAAKAADASDITSFEEGKAEVVRLRALLAAQSKLEFY